MGNYKITIYGSGSLDSLSQSLQNIMQELDRETIEAEIDDAVENDSPIYSDDNLSCVVSRMA